ncbi:LysR family transcriptional regulator [Chimaeribacter californicus]|uniref:LysR family transcriptional regulator n=1 Tax=Chimaeribacter californicus TaxID=2060067 RepID=A0A2N5EBW9_9GAMM|nr:LysR family transcriptional regulator [Chimaeribacter californicus]PLR39599.1 LysR family transcriptional regulator [Chimaeribacter californicus]
MPDIDLNLLTALDALLIECSVTRAAQRLGLSTSAMSRTLTRLRTATGDKLLVQAGRHMVPTPYALELAGRVHETALSARALLQPAGQGVNLATTERSFVIRAGEGFIDMSAAALLKEIQQVAPRIRLLFTGKSDKEAQALREGKIDLEIGVLGTDAPELKTRVLFTDRFVGICRQGHPLLEMPGVTAERYASFPHVVISRKNKLRGPVDQALDALGLQRHIMMSVPAYTNAVNIVRHSDVIGLVPFTALAWCDPCSELMHFELPVTTPPIKVSVIWHPRLHADPVHQWLRETIVKVCRREYSRHVRT